MELRKEDFLVDCVGVVTVLTDDRIVFQGKIKKERHNDNLTPYIGAKVEVNNENQFIVLVLNCDAAIISDNGKLQTIDQTLYKDGFVVRLNIAKIIAIGPMVVA